MILCLWSPLHPLSKLLAIQDHTQNVEEQLWIGGRREVSIIFYRPVTRSDLKQERSFFRGSVSSFLQLVVANVIPIYKNDSVICMNNYRPISLLSSFNKVLEKLVHKRLVNFIDKYNILYVNQFRFREQHSTIYATLLITDKSQRAIEYGLFSCVIFIDLSKAFDTVVHGI